MHVIMTKTYKYKMHIIIYNYMHFNFVGFCHDYMHTQVIQATCVQDHTKA